MLKGVVYWGLILILPVLFVTSTLAWEVNEPRVYNTGFEKYNVSQVTGINEDQLESWVAPHLVDYFNSKENTAQVGVFTRDRAMPLFNEKELTHLKDVRYLIQLDYWNMGWAFLTVVTCALVLLFRFRDWLALVKGLLYGSFITLGGTVAVIALVGALGFDRLFLLFHQVSFSNAFWMLDPSKDYLIMLFPQGFFYDAALLGFQVLISASLILSVIALTLTAARIFWKAKPVVLLTNQY